MPSGRTRGNNHRSHLHTFNDTRQILCTMKHLQLTLEQARALSGQSDDLDNLIRETWTEDELRGKPWRVKRFEALGPIMGCCVGNMANIVPVVKPEPCVSSRATFSTEQQAQSFGITYPMLTQLMARYREDWVPDWGNARQVKWCIYKYDGSIVTGHAELTPHPLSFPTKERAEAFLSDHRELILEFYKGM